MLIICEYLTEFWLERDQQLVGHNVQCLVLTVNHRFYLHWTESVHISCCLYYKHDKWQPESANN